MPINEGLPALEYKNPELPHRTPEEQALLTALLPQPLSAIKWGVELRRTAAALADSQLNPHTARQVMAVSELLSWQYLSMPDEPLPESCRLYQDNAGRLQVTYDPALRISDDSAIRNKLFYKRDGNVNPAFGTQVVTPEVLAAQQDLIKSSSAYKLLDTLVTPETGAATTQRPLNRAEHTARERQVEHEVKRSFGIGADESVEPGSVAYTALKGQLFGIDGERVPHKVPNESDARERVDVWLKTVAARWKGNVEPAPDAVVTSVYKSRFTSGGAYNTPIKVQWSDGTLSESLWQDLVDWSYDYAAETNGKDVYDTSDFYGLLGAQFVKQVVLDKRSDLKQALEEAVVETTNAAPFNLATAELRMRHEYNLGALRKPIAPVVSGRYESEHKVELEVRAAEFVTVGSLQDYLQEKATKVGSVIKRTEGKDVPRLIIPGYEVAPPESDAEPDLVLEDHGFQLWSSSIQIPGYQLLTSNASHHGFKRTEDDPYQGADMVRLHNVIDLAKEWRSIGLSQLADKLEALDEPSVADAARIISSESLYTFDESLSQHYGESNDEGPRLSRFGQCVKNGRLEVQCTGANIFLAESLRKSMHDTVVKVITGKVLDPSSDDINGVDHMQTMVTYNGRRYVLDATPNTFADRSSGRRVTAVDSGAGVGPMWRAAVNRLRYGRQPRTTSETETHHQNIDAAPINQTAMGESEPKTKTVSFEAYMNEHAQHSADAKLVASRKMVEMLLKSKFAARDNDALYEKLIKLSSADPARKVLEHVMRRGGDPAEDTQATAALKQYLEAYAQADAKTLARMRVGIYSQAFIKSLADSI